MEALDEVLWWEDFLYSDTANTDQFAVLPPSLEYSGQVLTSDGWLTLPGSGGFAMRRPGADNEDAKYPYGGTTAQVPAYLRFPVLDWMQTAGLLVHPITSAPSTLFFDVSFSGHASDKIYVLVQAGGVWSTRQVLTNVAGMSWNTRSVSLPAGPCTVAIVFATGSPVAASGGFTQPAGTLGQPGFVSIDHRLRIGNLRFTNPSWAPVAPNSRVFFPVDSHLGVTAVRTQFAQLTALVGTASVVGGMVSPHIDATVATTLTVLKAEAGAEASVTALVEPTISFTPQITMYSRSETGGFMLGARCALAVESELIPLPADLIRPLLTTSLTMAAPSLVAGKPITARARSTTASSATATASGHVVDRIDPRSVTHVYPAVRGGQPTHRWLSIDAQTPRDDTSCALWAEHDGGPGWSTPGGYTPDVVDFTMVSDSRHQALPYPAVVFDATRGDHLNLDLGTPSNTATWLLVGTFSRYRGALRDSCPILDLTATAAIDYAHEVGIDRSALPTWFDTPDPGTPSLYTGWTAYSDVAPGTSMLAYRGGGFDAAERLLPYADNTPVVLAITVDGLDSTVTISSILGTGPASGRLAVSTPREIFDAANPLPSTFTLGKGRFAPPFGGLFGTGSMSLLEVAYYDVALTAAEIASVSDYLAGVYAPASLLEPHPAYQQNAFGGGWNQVYEMALFFSTQDPPDSPYYILHDGQAVRAGADEVAASTSTGGGILVYLSTEDYDAFIAAYGAS